jgi:thymidylate synthase (FAD)
VPMWYFSGVGTHDAAYDVTLDTAVQSVPGESARISYSSGRLPPDEAVALSRKIVRLDHYTPLEAVQFNFRITGISKVCGQQMSRHRIGQGHVSSSRRYQEQKPAFVYPIFSDEYQQSDVEGFYAWYEGIHRQAFKLFQDLRAMKVSKQDARRVIPISSAQERVWWINARALRDFFRLRLAKDAEWETRRLAGMVLDVVKGVTPVLFEDVLT